MILASVSVQTPRNVQQNRQTVAWGRAECASEAAVISRGGLQGVDGGPGLLVCDVQHVWVHQCVRVRLALHLHILILLRVLTLGRIYEAYYGQTLLKGQSDSNIAWIGSLQVFFHVFSRTHLWTAHGSLWAYGQYNKSIILARAHLTRQPRSS